MFVFSRHVCQVGSKRQLRWATVLGWVVIAVSACSFSPKKFEPYRAEVVQGNFVSREQVQALRVGMPRNVVRDILGTPLVSSVFHDNRWDYAFTIRRQGAEPQQRHMSVFFQGDVLVKIEGDQMPSEAEFAARLDTRKLPEVTPPLKASEEQLVKELSQYPSKTKPASSASPLTDAPTPQSYPPLESPTH
jgi:outer membrane protein assembly factor BamE